MTIVTKDEFYNKLMAETRDVVSSCTYQGNSRYVSNFEYRYSRQQFGCTETSYSTYPAEQTYSLA